ASAGTRASAESAVATHADRPAQASPPAPAAATESAVAAIGAIDPPIPPAATATAPALAAGSGPAAAPAPTLAAATLAAQPVARPASRLGVQRPIRAATAAAAIHVRDIK